MLITVSPVPLLATFRNMDVLVANSYSKSVQRAALDEFLLDKEGMDYFPSFEYVTLSDPNFAWKSKDYRHPTDDVVKRIMDNVVLHYIDQGDNVEKEPEPEFDIDKVREDMRALLAEKKFPEILDYVTGRRDEVDQSFDLLVIESHAYFHSGDIKTAADKLDLAVGLAPFQPMPLERSILVYRKLDKKQKVKSLLKTHERKFPARQEFRDKIA